MKMFLCPFCTKKPWASDEKQTFRQHVKNSHGSGIQSGVCPHKECDRTFGDIYKYIQHVEKCHKPNKKQYSPKRKLDDVSDNDSPNKRACVKSGNPATNDNILQKNLTHQIDISPQQSRSSHIKVDYDKLTIKNNNSQNKLNNQQCFLSQKSGLAYAQLSSAFDERLLAFYNKLSEKGVGLVKNLFANVSVSHSKILEILKLISEYQQISIEELRKIDPDYFANNRRVNTALNFLKNPLSTVNTKAKLIKHLDSRNSFIKPVTKIIHIGLKPSLNKKTGRKTYVSHRFSMQYVPMKQVLTQFLQLPNVFKTISKAFDDAKKDDKLSSFIQGKYWQKIVQKYPGKFLIPIDIFFDDFEVNNPLGSHKQKIGGVYYTVSCLPPQFASKLENWFLAQFHKEVDFRRFGVKKVFANLKKELIELRDNGILIEIEGVEHRVFFHLGRILGDNLGLNQLLGFVRSFNATHWCRICIGENVQCRTELEENPELLRTEKNYQEDVEKAKSTGKHSRGVVEESFLQDVHDMRENPPCDPLHDELEGTWKNELPQVLNNLICDDKINFTLSDLNNSIKLLNIDRASGINFPADLSEDMLIGKVLKLSASEMSFMVKYLGILIGKYIPRENKTWQLYLTHRKLYYLIMAPSYTDDSAQRVRDLIRQHRQLYKDLNFGPCIPKHHLVNHYPRLMSSGPLRYASGIRGEAVHRDRKRTANAAVSRKNSLFTLAERYQLNFAKRLYDQEPLSSVKSFKIKKETTLKNLKNYIEFEKISPVFGDEKIELLSEANYDGTLYKTGVSVIIDSKKNLPTFADIEYIIKKNESAYFIVNELTTCYFDEHIQAYIVEATNKWLFIQHHNLPTYETFYSQNIDVIVDHEIDKAGTESMGKTTLEKKRVIVRTYV